MNQKLWPIITSRLLGALLSVFVLSAPAWAAPHVVVDTAFGNEGVAQIPAASSIALASDGKILALGSDGEALILRRYSKTGAPDFTFGINGAVSLSAEGRGLQPSNFSSLLVAADGRFYIAGFPIDGCQVNDPCSTPVLARYRPTGELDTSFGVRGYAPLSIGQYAPTAQTVSLAFGPNGTIVAAENAGTPGSRFYPVTVQSRLETFRSDGTAVASWPLSSTCQQGIQGLVVHADGKILVSVLPGYGTSNVMRCLSRYTSDGSLDATFGSAGVVFWEQYLGTWPNTSGLLLGADGRLMLGVYTYTNDNAQDGAVIRFTADGRVDSAFGVPNGSSVAPANVHVLAQGCGGKFLGAVRGHDSFYSYVGMTRYNSNGSLDLTASGTADGIVSKFVSFIDDVQEVLVRDDGEVIVRVAGRMGTIGTQVTYLVAYRQLDCQHPTDASLTPVIEFYNGSLNHYFVSDTPADIEALDSGRFAGWQRTGYTFTTTGNGGNPVCRFYIPPAYGDSHFFSGSRAECDDVRVKFPQFVFETPDAFRGELPDAVSGLCSSSWPVPVYRLWNAKADTNHRYVTDKDVRDQMVTAGWTAEGYGPDGVALCAKQP